MDRRPQAPGRGQVRRVRLRRQHRRADGGVDGHPQAATPALTRPAIATVFPTARNPIVVLDSGANVDCCADGARAVRAARRRRTPRTSSGATNPCVGLLSIGEEAEKGNAVVKEAHQLLAASGLNFIGNVEGRDLPNGRSRDRGPIDVVVCDGFVGNVVLKFYEAVAPIIIGLLQEAGRRRASS